MNIIERIVKLGGGFIRADQVAELAEYDRLRQVLVRCGCGRFACAAQDVAHFCAIIERDAKQNATETHDHFIGLTSDYVRDVSLLATDRAYKGHFGPVTPQTRPQQPIPTAAEICDFSTPDAAEHPDRYLHRFREEDCGGAFDGFGVTSDADPGL